MKDPQRSIVASHPRIDLGLNVGCSEVGSITKRLPARLYVACAGGGGSALSFVAAAGIELIHIERASGLIRSRLSTGCILLDLDLQQECVSTIASLLSAGGIHMPLIVATAQASVDDAVDWMRRGARDYISKPYDAADFIQRLAFVWTDFLKSSVAESDGNDVRLKQLTVRQRAVLKLLSRGLTSKEIGAHMSLSVRTVEMHRRRMLMALGVHRTIEALAIASGSRFLHDS